MSDTPAHSNSTGNGSRRAGSTRARRRSTWWLLLVGVSVLAACADVGEPQTPPTVERPATLAAEPDPLPGVTLTDGTLLDMDTRTPRFKVTVAGAPGFVLIGDLVDGVGRRALSIGTPRGVIEPIAAGAWHLPPMAAPDAAGRLLVCFNRLIGQPTGLNGPDVPDARGGVALLCRRQQDGAWSPEARLMADQTAAWLTDMAPTADGVALVVMSDDGALVGAPDGDTFHHRVEIIDGLVGDPVLLENDP